MMAAERNLGRLGQLVQYSVGKPDQYYFQQMSRRGGIEDDHIPFMIRGTSVSGYMMKQGNLFLICVQRNAEYGTLFCTE
jgi:hypothetical protein